jgi:hypothetical protein
MDSSNTKRLERAMEVAMALIFLYAFFMVIQASG